MRRSIQLLLRFVAITAFGVLALGLISSQILPQLARVPDAVTFKSPTKLQLPTLPEGSQVVDGFGQPIGKLQGAENRVVIPLDQMSKELVGAVLAVEDADFYKHEGVSAKSVLRAIKANSDAGAVSQGGSTITQQLVKLSLVGSKRSIERKIKEASLAIQLEQQLCEGVSKHECKDRILQQYMNTIYLGQGAYGVEAAAQTYFNKPASQVNLAEAAMLAGLINDPSGNDPIRFPDAAKRRRSVALQRMIDTKMVDEKQAKFIDAVPVPSQVFGRGGAVDSQSLTYLERKVRDELLQAEWLGSTPEQRQYLIFNGGLKIYTTIDARAQLLAEQAVASSPHAKPNDSMQTALVSVDPSTGAVRAIVGEATVNNQPFELAYPTAGVKGFSSGSAFKPFTLIAALEQGYTIRDTIAGDPLSDKVKKQLGVPSGKSYPGDCPTKGQQPLSEHLAASNNCAFMRLQNAVGIDRVKMAAIKLGISPDSLDPNNANPACFTIGCDSFVRPLDMANAYATIENDGRRNPAHFVDRVEDRSGKVIWQYQPVNEQVITPQVAREAIVAMEGVVTHGTCTNCALPHGQPVAGKTGTDDRFGTNENLWFVGFTPHLSTAVWVGVVDGNKGEASGVGVGARVAGPVWRKFMAAYLDGAPVIDFPGPGSISGGRAVPDPWGPSDSKSGSGSTSGSGSGSGNSGSGNSGSGNSGSNSAPGTKSANKG
jgi:membrane peptidoglycan carboxypeptidase